MDPSTPRPRAETLGVERVDPQDKVGRRRQTAYLTSHCST